MIDVSTTKAELEGKIRKLQEKLDEMTEVLDAIRSGSVDALAITKDGKSDIFTLQSTDYTYRILVEKYGEGALSLSDTGLILYSNIYFANLINIPLSKLIGSYIHSYLSEESRTVFEDLFKSAMEGNSKGEVILSFNQKSVPVYISLNSLKPQLPHIGMIVSDLTEKLKNQRLITHYQIELEHNIQQLKQSNQELEQFVHIISHDLKEPLRKIAVYGDRLKELEGSKLLPKSTESLNILRQAALRMNTLIEDLLNYSTTTKGDSNIELCDLDSIIALILQDLELVIAEKKAEIKIESLPRIRGSSFQLSQLFLNLLTNSLKYSKPQTPVRVTISSEIVSRIEENQIEREFYKILVKDNGIGFDQKYEDKIFTIFQRLHGNHEYEGTGIGLAICKKIVENHNGFFKVKSKIGEGATFIIYLPVS